MVSIAPIIRQIKKGTLDVQGILDIHRVEQIFIQHGHQWRNRTLGPAQTVELFIRQVMEGNESCGYVRQCGNGAFTASAYCAARSRLPLAAVWALGRGIWEQVRLEHESALALWHGHRTFHLDGTNFSMPDTPELQAAFGQPSGQQPGCGFPIAHLLVSFDARTGMVLDAIPAPLNTHDLRNVQEIHRQLQSGDILIGDKAFGSWAHMALLQGAGIHGLFPLHQRRPSKSENSDCLERWPKPPNKPAWMSQEQFDVLPPQIQVRVIHRVIQRRGFRPLHIAATTTLLDANAYSADELIELGRGRWSAELNFRHLKTTMGLEMLKCKSVERVLKELAVFLLVYNLVRAVMLKAARAQGVAADRISFADALDWIRRTSPGAELWNLIVNPARPGRIEPRAVKRRPKEYDRLNRPRDKMRNALKPQRI
jgi:hypothetical protein